MYKETENIDLIVKAFNDGKVVILPTDTLFGLSCNINNEYSVKKIYEIKKRPFSQPLSIAVKNKDYIYKITNNVSQKAKEIIENYFPGKVTIVLEKNNIIPDYVTSGSKYVGIRIPDDEKLLYILDKLDYPIVLTSANIHGLQNCKNINEVKNQIGYKVDYIYNISEEVSNQCSTIVKVIGNNLEILRNGATKIY